MILRNVLLITVVLAACADNARDSSSANGDTTTAEVRDSLATPSDSTDLVRPTSPQEWVVRTTGVDGIVIGLSLDDFAAYLRLTSDTTYVGDGCEQFAVLGAPDGLAFMVEQRQLVRVDVYSGETPTAEGARIGDEEARILELYPGVRREPHKYTDGFYLIAIPGAPGDTLHRYVFETDDGQRVTRYRAGLYPPVEYVEGCA